MNKYVALMIHFMNVPLIPNFCAGGDKVSFTTHLTNAEELSTSLPLGLILQPFSPADSV